MDIHKRQLERELQRAYQAASIINFGLISLFTCGIYYLLNIFLEDKVRFPYGPEFYASLLIFFLVFAFIWSRWPESLGQIFVRRTNKYLKNFPQGSPSQIHLRSSRWFGVTLLVVTALVGAHETKFSFIDLFSEEGLEGAWRIFTALFTPEFKILGLVISSMIETIFIALVATALALPAAFFFSFFCARNLMRSSKSGMTVYNVLRFIFNFSRSIEPLIWAIVFSVWVGIGPFAGMLALFIHSISSLAKLYSEQIESIDQGPIEAIEATGANKLQVIWYAVVPQIVLPYLSFTIYRWDINIRMATVIGLVGGGGVGTLLMQYQGLARWHEVGTIVIVIATVVWFMDYVSAKLREAIY